MGILQTIRTKFAVDMLDSAALTQELGDWLAKQNKNEQDTQAIRGGLALDAIRSIDGGKTSTDKLERLGREHTAIEATIAVLRTEIAAATAREKAAEVQARRAESQRLGDVYIAATRTADAARAALADALAETKQAQVAFERSLSTRVPGYVSMIASAGAAFAFDAVRAQLLPEVARPPVPTLEAMARDEVAAALRMWPIESEQQSATRGGDPAAEVS